MDGSGTAKAIKLLWVALWKQFKVGKKNCVYVTHGKHVE